MTSNYVLFRSLFVDAEVPLEKEKGLEQKELEKSTDESAKVESEETQDTDVEKVGAEEEKGEGVGDEEGESDEEGKGEGGGAGDKGAAQYEAPKKPGLVQFVMWSHEEMDVDRREEGNVKDSENLDLKVQESKSQMGFLEVDNTDVEDTEMQLEEEKLDLRNVEDEKLNLRNLEDEKLDLSNVEEQKLDLRNVEDEKLNLSHVEDEKLDLSHVEAKTDIRALFDTDSESDSDL